MSFNSILHFTFRKVAAVFLRMANALIKFAYLIYQPPQSLSEKNKKEWYRIGGDESLRVQYNVSDQSVVFDIGGFQGDWCAEIYARYSPFIFVFEPVREFYEKLTRRFQKNNKIKVFHYGLSGRDGKTEIAVMSESSSIFRSASKGRDNSKKQEIILKSINAFIRENNIERIDLVKINIEGGEYELLESLIGSGIINKLDNIQIQFHDFVDNAVVRMENIKKQLSETHYLTYEYVFVWENWKRKN
jgi:FkbM family methyltransferase